MRKLIDVNSKSVEVSHREAIHKHSKAHESAVRQVSGSARYVDDIPEPANLLHAAVGLSTEAAGTITKLDLSQVLESTGVIDVITVDDVPGHIDIAPVFDGDPVLANKHIKFYGQPIFAVLADTVNHARQAVDKAKVSYQIEPAILDVQEAREQKSMVRPAHFMINGDACAGIEQAPFNAHDHLSIGGQEHLYLEGQVSLAVPEEENRMLIYTSSQHPSEVQKLVAEVLDIPLNRVVVDMRRMGGGFGGKETQAAQWACIAALFANRTARAVKLRLPRMQDMLATGKRHPFENSYRVGFDQNGKITAAHIELRANCGHSPDLSDAIVDRAMFHADNCYFLPHGYIEGHRLKTHQVSHTAFRGFGGPQGMIMAEAMIDKIARRLTLDPLTVRKRNLYSPENGTTTPYGMQIEHHLIGDMIARLETSSNYWARRESIKAFNATSPIIKKGLALTPVKFGISFTAKHLNQAGALVHIYTDGSIQANHGGTEMGQGLHTKIAHIVANEFGVDFEHVEVTSTRTDKVPNTSPTAASSGTDLNGKAVQNACQIIKQRLAEFFAKEHNGNADMVHFANGKVTLGEVVVPFEEAVQRAYMARISLSSSGFYKTPKIHYNRETGKGRPFFYFAYGAAVSQVSLDTLTGEHKVTHVDILHDVGRSLNPAIDIGQIEGGFIQGMGWLTSEDLRWDKNGKLTSNNLATYKIPSIGDTPEVFNVDLYERDNDEASIYYSKAVGEPPFMLAISVWSALKDAVSSLANYQVDPQLHTPATPERVMNAIKTLRESMT